MKDVVVDEIIYIDEKIYQQIKNDMCKSEDYFYFDEIQLLMKLR